MNSGDSKHQLLIVLIVCLVLDSLLIGFFLLHLDQHLLPNYLVRFLNPDAERSIPTWFSSLKLGVAGGCLLFSSMGSGLVNQKRLIIMLGAALVFLSLDESVGIHEHLGFMLAQISWMPRFEGNHGVWVAPYLLIFVTLAAVSFQSTVRLYDQHPRSVT